MALPALSGMFNLHEPHQIKNHSLNKSIAKKWNNTKEIEQTTLVSSLPFLRIPFRRPMTAIPRCNIIWRFSAKFIPLSLRTRRFSILCHLRIDVFPFSPPLCLLLCSSWILLYGNNQFYEIRLFLELMSNAKVHVVTP